LRFYLVVSKNPVFKSEALYIGCKKSVSVQSSAYSSRSYIQYKGILRSL